MNPKSEQIREMLAQLSDNDFRNVGVNQVAYIRAAGQGGFAVHAADGALLSQVETLDLAIAAVRHNDMQPVTVH